MNLKKSFRNDTKDGPKRELFVTEAQTLRQLIVVREEFVEPLVRLSNDRLELEMLATSLDFIKEFINFRITMFEKLHPKRYAKFYPSLLHVCPT